MFHECDNFGDGSLFTSVFHANERGFLVFEEHVALILIKGQFFAVLDEDEGGFEVVLGDEAVS